MSDITKRGPDCDDDCEGERGERGKRGHRGHRGNDGRDGDVGSTGPAGDTGSTGPAGPAGPSLLSGPANTCLIFRPGSGLTGPTVFDSWIDLMAELAALRAANNGAGCYEIMVDDTIVSPAVIPPGLYDMTDVILAGRAHVPTLLTIPEGVIFTGLRTLRESLQVTFTGTTPPVSDIGELPFAAFAIDGGTSITATGSGPFIRVGSNLAIIALRDGSRITFGGTPVIDVTVVGPGTGILVAGFALGTLESNTISGVAGASAFIKYLVSSARLSEDQPTFTGAGGLLTFGNDTVERRFPTTVFTSSGMTEPNVVTRVDTNSGPVTITLPPAFNNRGVSIVVKDVGGNAAAANITIVPSGGDTIDGGFAQFITAARGSRTFTSDGGSDWMTTAQSS